MNSWLAVFMGGGLGSCCRFGLSLAIGVSRSGFPYATLVANMLSCIVLGLAARYLLPKGEAFEGWKMLVMVGFCGGFSTFSTFSRESYLLLQQGSYWQTFAYVMLSFLSCLFILWGIESGKV